MRLGIGVDPDKGVWCALDITKMEDGREIQPFVDDVKFLIKPGTKANLAKVEKAAKRSKLARRHTTEEGEVVEGNASDSWTKALANELLLDWSGVTDVTGQEELPCEEMTKLMLFEDQDIALWVLNKARQLARVEVETERKNSVA